jgi:hypothetical protein
MKISQEIRRDIMTRDEEDGDLRMRALRLMREIDAVEIKLDLEAPSDLEGLRAHLAKLAEDIERLAEEERENRDPSA